MPLDMHCNADTINNPAVIYCKTEEYDNFLLSEKMYCNTDCTHLYLIAK